MGATAGRGYLEGGLITFFAWAPDSVCRCLLWRAIRLKASLCSAALFYYGGMAGLYIMLAYAIEAVELEL